MTKHLGQHPDCLTCAYARGRDLGMKKGATEVVEKIVADLRTLDSDWDAYVAAGLDGVDEERTYKALADHIEQKWGSRNG